MRCAFFIDRLSNGGAERVTTILANYFSKTSEVYLFIADDSQTDYKLCPSIHIEKVPFSKSKIERVLSRKKYICKRIKELGFDACITLTYTFLPYILFSPKKKRGKVISSLRNAPQFECRSFFEKILRWFGFSLSDKVVFQTPDARAYFNKRIRERGIIIPNPLLESLPIKSDEQTKTVITATRLEKQKNIFLALDAFKSFHKTHSDWSFLIFGRGSLQGEIEQRIADDSELVNCVFLRGFSSDLHKTQYPFLS